ncbi:apolipoprotein B-100 [Caerostris extrusa]|uniref:Apolipoprotein B-100 n=1 Tax=Caerostris extrusa TaxID=172846 RepID=A0AAV4XKQ3_CAEEX|nr:apolipoprotein B-100 [Caerostris extrusa]
MKERRLHWKIRGRTKSDRGGQMVKCTFTAIGNVSNYKFAIQKVQPKNVLQPGYDYIYRFESKVVAEAVGTTDDKSEISISCDVFISHVSSCLYTFILDKCSTKAIEGPPGSESAWIEDQPLFDLSKYPVLFSLSNGEITEIQVDENDPIHFVNIKRGALSAFVFKLSYTTQPSKEMHTDVHGACPWSSYPVLGSEGSVHAEKDMLHCSFQAEKTGSLARIRCFGIW